jgi:mannose/fructose/N-acetylgalactosamine-specific phosphotransferase system component IIC
MSYRMDVIALLTTATLLGGMVFFSFGFAPVLFAQLPMERVRPLLRGTFPYYYLAVIGLSAMAALLAIPVSGLAAGLLGAVALTTVYARQDLMHRINAATDRDDTGAFKRLHGLSVVIQIAQIGLAGWAVALVG